MNIIIIDLLPIILLKKMNNANDVARWTTEGKRIGATHLIVLCDEFDFDVYPKYVMNNEKLADKLQQWCTNDNMQSLKEVITL